MYKLDVAVSQSINLSQLFTGITPANHLDAVITIAPGKTVHLVDDVQMHGVGKAKIQFIVQDDAIFSYLFKMVDGIDGVHEHNAAPQQIERELIVTLAGAGAQATVTCLCFGHMEKSFKFKTLQDHQAERATSNVIIKSVLDDSSKLFCQGLIHIQRTGQRTSADLVNKNILLSRQARAISIPMLEVEADDVRCSHSAAISKLDKEQMFYLQSRGLDMPLTKQLLIQAFLT